MKPLLKHGTINRYLKNGCRCEQCRAKWAEYQKAYRARKKEECGGV